MPEIPLSVGSKLELLLSLPNFRILPRTLTHLSAYICILPCIYVYISYNYTMYMTEAPRVLHFSAFIVECISNETTISIPVYDVESDSKYVLTMITVATFDDIM